jgi:hypothetical protein
MPGLEILLIENILKNEDSKFKIFVETGTLHAQTVLNLEHKFDELHTIEVMKELYDSAIKYYNGEKIKFHLGDSIKTLPKVINTLNDNTIFFLDGHWSCGHTSFGEKHVPLFEELDSIMKFKHKSIIIIDDVRLFGYVSPVDWSEITVDKILDKVKNRLKKHYTMPSRLDENDRLVIHLHLMEH